MNIDQILNLNNFTDFSRNQLVEMLQQLQHEVKTIRFTKDYYVENLQHSNNTLHQNSNQQLHQIATLESLTQFYLQLLEKPLTVKERLIGKKIIG